jgi:hypothetical protein
MERRLAPLVVSVCLCAPSSAPRVEARSATIEQQPQAPALSRQQRDLLLALVNAVDGAPAAPRGDDLPWQVHLMRASDGSHYVAFTIVPSGDAPLPKGPAMLYVRLATSNPLAAEKIAERSVIREWLAGTRTDPRLRPRRNIAIGDMPAFGPSGTIGVRGSTATTGSNELKLMALERENARKEQEQREKQRREELEGKSAAAREHFPFEDFDLSSISAENDGTRVITRAFTAGPGDYELVLAWADPAARPPAVRVVRKPLHLPPASATDLAVGSIIMVDRVTIRDAPYPATEQASHPYSIGLMEITPARDALLTREEELSVAFQIMNARPSDSGKPDVAVNFRIVRVTDGKEAPFASLNPQFYNASNLPPEFDLRLGHPVFAAMSAPMATLTRGAYRLKILVTDRLGSTSTTADMDFRIAATPASLLAEAPALAPPFARDAALDRSRATLIDALAPGSPSPALARALATARAGKMVDLLVEEPVSANERGVRTALTGLALLSIGDASAVVQLQRAATEGAPAAPTQFLIGMARAGQNRDLDAIAAWDSALTGQFAPPLTRQFLAEALLRRGDHARSLTVIGDAAAATPAFARLAAAAHIAAGRPGDAITILDAHLATAPQDLDAQWLRLHALYAAVVKGAPTERFTAEAERYIEANGPHRALAQEWLALANNK